jgi:hypothetical protein
VLWERHLNFLNDAVLHLIHFQKYLLLSQLRQICTAQYLSTQIDLDSDSDSSDANYTEICSDSGDYYNQNNVEMAALSDIDDVDRMYDADDVDYADNVVEGLPRTESDGISGLQGIIVQSHCLFEE